MKLKQKFWVILPDVDNPLTITPFFSVWKKKHEKVVFDLGVYRTEKKAKEIIEKIKKLTRKESEL